MKWIEIEWNSGSVCVWMWYGVLNAAYRGRSEKFDPFEPLNGSQRIPERRSSLLRVEDRDLGQGTPFVFRESDADTDCDKQRFSIAGGRQWAVGNRQWGRG